MFKNLNKLSIQKALFVIIVVWLVASVVSDLTIYLLRLVIARSIYNVENISVENAIRNAGGLINDSGLPGCIMSLLMVFFLLILLRKKYDVIFTINGRFTTKTIKMFMSGFVSGIIWYIIMISSLLGAVVIFERILHVPAVMVANSKLQNGLAWSFGYDNPLLINLICHLFVSVTISIIFIGFLFPVFRKRMSFFWSAIACGLLFVIGQGEIYAASIYMVNIMRAAFLYEHEKSLVPVIAFFGGISLPIIFFYI